MNKPYPKFHASEVGALMVDGRGSKLTEKQQSRLEELEAKKAVGTITEKQLEEYNRLSEVQNKGFQFGGTAMALIKKVWLRWKYGYSEPVKSDEMKKGIECEKDSLDLLMKVRPVGMFRSQNTLRFENEYLTGEMDVILDFETFTRVEDVKTCFSIKTFMEAEPTPLYIGQGQAYMRLIGATEFHLHYCLVRSPEDLVTELKKRWWYHFNMVDDDPDYINIAKQIEHNHLKVPELVPLQERVKTFVFQKDSSYIEEMENRIRLAWQVMDGLKL